MMLYQRHVNCASLIILLEYLIVGECQSGDYDNSSEPYSSGMAGSQTGLLVMGITLFILIISFCVFCQKVKDNSDVITPRPVSVPGFENRQHHLLEYSDVH
ncbi:uncharacterized protein LOC144623137 [Crassostrea virginica]